MPTHKQNKVETQPSPYGPDGKFAMGVADTERMRALFPQSPIFLGEISDDERLAAAQANLKVAVNDEGHTSGEQNLTYDEAPDVAAGPFGEGTDVPNPYVPNPTSPGPGSINAADKPDAPAGFGEKTADTPGVGDGSRTNPKNTSATTAGLTLGALQQGIATREDP